jgi:DNA-binding LacI/PurR family transcriptional regulator/DNA-binding transcriptional regulator YhcF (GntR family)
MRTDTETTLPPQQRVTQSLRQEVIEGRWRPGGMIPGRHALARRHAVPLSTVERAVAILISEGLFRSEDRRGTFVADAPPAEAPTPPFTARPMPPPAVAPLTGTIGIVTAVHTSGNAEEYESQWGVKVVHGCEHRLAADPGLTTRSINPWTIAVPSPLAATTEAITRLMDERVAAIILVGNLPVSPDFVVRQAAARIPIVFANYERGDHPFPQVCIDNMAAGAAAARHLLTRGYPRLLYFQPFAATWSDERLAGVRSMLGATAADPARLRVIPDRPEPAEIPNQRELAYQRAHEVLADDAWAPHTGVIAVNDYAAEEFARAAAGRGLVAGRDYGLLGFDDRGRERGLTSLRPPLEELGREAAGLAVRLLRGESPPLRIVLQHQVIARTSTRGQEEALGVRR